MEKPFLIVMAGLPGSGKTTLANKLAETVPAVIINKDVVRAAFFPPREIDFSAAQDDLVMSMIYQAAAYLVNKGRSVIIDGQAYALQLQRLDLKKTAYAAGADLRIILCSAPDEIVKERLQKDVISNIPADERDFDLFLQQKAVFEPIEEPHLAVNTDAPLEELSRLVMDWLDINP